MSERRYELEIRAIDEQYEAEVEAVQLAYEEGLRALMNRMLRDNIVRRLQLLETMLGVRRRSLEAQQGMALRARNSGGAFRNANEYETPEMANPMAALGTRAAMTNRNNASYRENTHTNVVNFRRG